MELKAPKPFPKLQALGGGQGFWDWILGGKKVVNLNETRQCGFCGKVGTEEQIQTHDCKYAFGE